VRAVNGTYVARWVAVLLGAGLAASAYRPVTWAFGVERVTGIEPALSVLVQGVRDGSPMP
jgi:hypothetical protein